MLDTFQSNVLILQQEYTSDPVPRKGGTAAVLTRRTMPARAALLAAGRRDLVRAINAAGGFLAVAQTLGLRSKRRPIGYWENLDNLDEVNTHS